MTEHYFRLRYIPDIHQQQKLDRLKINPRKECGAHPLHGKLKGKWACWLGLNVRMTYIIDDVKRIIWVEDVGTHKIY